MESKDDTNDNNIFEQDVVMRTSKYTNNPANQNLDEKKHPESEHNGFERSSADYPCTHIDMRPARSRIPCLLEVGKVIIGYELQTSKSWYTILQYSLICDEFKSAACLLAEEKTQNNLESVPILPYSWHRGNLNFTALEGDDIGIFGHSFRNRNDQREYFSSLDQIILQASKLMDVLSGETNENLDKSWKEDLLNYICYWMILHCCEIHCRKWEWEEMTNGRNFCIFLEGRSSSASKCLFLNFWREDNMPENEEKYKPSKPNNAFEESDIPPTTSGFLF
mmetsp:Transcript_22537/g.29263  ORF Transcript_22537/g.29263 Transcript_22537/m.29263 type:complete len:279 (-) Transcript_22537:417-1253(-)|eukprot:CAMPEP_0117753332 /NCGR_PEP_ID=MMETSP0947-20121206/12158_1 /TAXON_ID=44440 /ORGANISM="Chattonella subsalsa, Strain CCMP2191" /LENGTH=278 /DNA_ID=CAMNT_0005572185 /DNA_START=179 /DNA_END=1015 /DNA_ORIENTATION=+